MISLLVLGHLLPILWTVHAPDTPIKESFHSHLVTKARPGMTSIDKLVKGDLKIQ